MEIIIFGYKETGTRNGKWSSGHNQDQEIFQVPRRSGFLVPRPKVIIGWRTKGTRNLHSTVLSRQICSVQNLNCTRAYLGVAKT